MSDPRTLMVHLAQRPKLEIIVSATSRNLFHPVWWVCPAVPAHSAILLAHSHSSEARSDW